MSDSRQFDDDFSLEHVDGIDDSVHPKSLEEKTESVPSRLSSGATDDPAWYKRLDMHWCGFLVKKDHGPITYWRKRWFELRQPFLRPESTFPVLVYTSPKMQKDRVIRVQDVHHALNGRVIMLTMDVVESDIDENSDTKKTRKMVVSVPDEARNSNFHTKLLMMLEGARRFRLALEQSATTVQFAP